VLFRSMHVVSSEPQLFFDVSLIKKGAQATAIGLSDDTMGIVDQTGETVYLLTVSSKNGQVVAGGDAFDIASCITVSSDQLYVMTGSGVHAIRLSDKKTTPQVIKKDSQWGTIGSLGSYGGNVYLLDTTKSRIWKYVATERGFSELREYLNSDTLPDLTKATSMAIDGSVWVGTGDGKILRFTQGKENTFVPQGVEPALGSDLSVYTSDTARNLYVLDRQNKRVVVLDKDGTYLAQYVWEQNLGVSGVVVLEKDKEIFILAEGKIFVIGLK